MTDERTPGDEPDRIPISLDGYGIEFETSVEPDATGVEEPQSIEEIWPMVKKELGRIAVHFVGVPADILKAVRGIARGIGGFGPAVNRRITGAQALADSQEDRRRAAALEELPAPAALPTPISKTPFQGAVESRREFEVTREMLENDERLQHYLKHQQNQGKHVEIRALPNDMFAIIITRPEAGPGAAAAAEDFDPDQ